MKTALVITLAVFAQAVGNTCLSKGMKSVVSSGDMMESLSPLILWRAMEEPLIWMGTVCLVLFFILFSAALTWEDLSFVLPVSAFGYILNVAFASYFLHEPVSPLRWLGTGLIIFGVVLVSRSGKSTGGEQCTTSDHPWDGVNGAEE
jgi:drug/metabolite transporter (DMT)-like permease